MSKQFSRMGNMELLAEVDQAVAQMHEKGIKVNMTVEIVDCLAAVGAMQLALRHPGIPPGTRSMVVKLIGQLEFGLQEYPALVELIRRGGLEEYDVSDSEYQAFRLVHPGGQDGE